MTNALQNMFSKRLRRAANQESKLAMAAELLEALSGQFDAEICEALLRELGTAILRSWVTTLPESVNSAYLRALATDRCTPNEASRAWERFIALAGGRDPYHLLAYAQALAEEKRFEEAAHQLRLALAQQVPYTFFARAEKLVDKLSSQAIPSLRRARIAILATATSPLMIGVLKALCLRDRIQADFYQGLYGAITQEILDLTSGLSRFRPEIVFLVQNWRDLSLPAISADEDAVVAEKVEQQKELWQQLASRFGCHVVQHAFDFPSEESYGYLAGALRGGRSRVIAAINQRMLERASAGISVLDTAAVQRRIGSRWEDPALWHNFKQHPSSEALPALAEAQQCHIRAVLGLTRKVLVTDLDNTLWKGIIGEDGLEGIQIGPETPAGEAHQALQRYLRDLKERGILLAVCSKNNPREARLPFEKHEHMVLRLEDFAAFYANWDDKVENLRAIAAKLSLGLDSFVFLDDNPMEREWVRSQLPEVAVLELGPSPFGWVRDLDRANYFFSLVLSEEDRERTRQYQSAAQVDALRAQAHTFEDFLSDLQLEASAVPVSATNLTRVTQLINKTNQFNLTTRRYTEEQVLQLASEPSAWSAAFRLRDRMGSYGLVAVVLCKPAGDPEEWEVDTWLMSCRVLGRQLELFMVDRMVEAAISQGIKRIIGVYRPTAKNSLVAGVYEKVGFSKISETHSEVRYLLEVPAVHQRVARYIRDVSSSVQARDSSEQAVAA